MKIFKVLILYLNQIKIIQAQAHRLPIYAQALKSLIYSHALKSHIYTQVHI